MDKEKVKQWLDAVSDACNTLIKNSAFEGFTYSTSFIKEMNCFVTAEELREMSDAAGRILCIRENYTENYPYCYYFTYNGVKFLCLSKTKISGRKIADAGKD